METVNIVNTVQKAVTPKASSVAVSNNANSEVNSSQVGKTLPEETRLNQAPQAQAIEKTVSELNDFVQSIQRGIQFSVQEGTGRSIITVTDKETGEEIRKFPSEEALAIAEFIAEARAQKDAVKGLVFNQSA
ncbi:MAG: flagellar biosynthesis protein FlaG [Piscirickettsiaceae bacterium]|nr:MAG: flagellar biosynthesis protein FlaG [Piscirickettsiaceae bacterium]